MARTVKLKNQAGLEVTYSNIEQVTIPLASGNGNATFVAEYHVSKVASTYITYIGGGYAANTVDYMCRISTGTTGKKVPDSVTLKIGESVATSGTHYTYTKLSDSEAVVSVLGAHITGDIVIEAVAVTS